MTNPAHKFRSIKAQYYIVSYNNTKVAAEFLPRVSHANFVFSEYAIVPLY
jgi:hypothetical protein